MPSNHFVHLEKRCEELAARFLDPVIHAEQLALANGLPLPKPDYDGFAAFRLLVHAELENYFELKAADALADLQARFQADRVFNAGFFSLILLHHWRKRESLVWPDDRVVPDSFIKNLAQKALGFGRQTIKENNGIKEESFEVISALIGVFPDDLDDVLVKDLDSLGRKRGDVAHSSWRYNLNTFESADIEKDRVSRILTLTKAKYEK
jgi:hypothetical protein